MDLFNELKGNLKKLKKFTKEKFDLTKLELKAKKYNYLIDSLFIELGSLFYNSKKQHYDISSSIYDNIIENIDMYKNKVYIIEKQLNNIKEKSFENKNITEIGTNFTKLDVDNEDLVFTRTKDGVEVLRYCYNCNSGNLPSNDTCYNCGTILKNTKKI